VVLVLVLLVLLVLLLVVLLLLPPMYNLIELHFANEYNFSVLHQNNECSSQRFDSSTETFRQ
jgi:hypothetical protein